MGIKCFLVKKESRRLWKCSKHHNGTDHYAIREKQAELLQKVRQFCFIILLIFTETVLCDIEEV